MARSAVNGSRLAGMHPWKRGAWLMGSTLAYRGQLVGQLLGRDHAGVRAAHDVEGRALAVGPEGGDAAPPPPTRSSRLTPPITVASTQMSVMVPVSTSVVTPRARRAPSSTVPLKPS